MLTVVNIVFRDANALQQKGDRDFVLVKGGNSLPSGKPRRAWQNRHVQPSEFDIEASPSLKMSQTFPTVPPTPYRVRDFVVGSDLTHSPSARRMAANYRVAVEDCFVLLGVTENLRAMEKTTDASGAGGHGRAAGCRGATRTDALVARTTVSADGGCQTAPEPLEVAALLALAAPPATPIESRELPPPADPPIA